MAILIGIFEEGLVYAIMALGVYITYRILDFPDLSVDGTFPMGGAITAVLIIAGVNPIFTLPISFMAGAISGILTGLIHVKLKVRDLLSGIIMMTALYSLNLRIAGSSNVPIFSKPTIFENALFDKYVPDAFRPYLVVTLLVIIVIVMKLLLDLYLRTRSGYLLRAVGDNDTLVTSLAKDKGSVKIIGLAIANAFVALAGSIYTQMSGFHELSIGTGTVVIGLASVIIGTNLFKRAPLKATTAVIIGSILYKACVAAAIIMGMEAKDMKLIISILFLIILVISHDRKRRAKQNA